jgi:RNA polymerase sigma-70 factor (ECF subfamily)
MRACTDVDEKDRFREVAADHLSGLYALARRLAGEDAEDAVQECLLRAFRSFSQLQEPEAARVWLASILVNVCRDRARSKARRPQEVSLDDVEGFSLYRKVADEDPFPYSDSLHLDFLHQFTNEDLHEVLRSLPDLYRVPLVLVHMDGFATKEVATMLKAPLGTVLARLHRGRKLFEKRMWDYALENGMLREVVT